MDEIPNTEQSSTGKFLSSLSAIKEYWIIDYGATDHVCHNLNVFTSYTKIKPVLISLPNGQTVYTTYSGLVRFSDKFYLSYVFYVPHFQLNLISVSDPAGNSNVEESLRSTLFPVYATASSAESPPEPSLASPNVACKTHRRRL